MTGHGVKHWTKLFCAAARTRMKGETTLEYGVFDMKS
jgi:hypothetical protein